MRLLILLLLAAAAALLLAPAPALAHAALASSSPAAGATLDVVPAALTLEFTERLDPAFSRVQLFDDTHTLLAVAETVRPEAPYALALELPALARGSYTAVWRVRSAEDGHVTEGTVPFGVGVAPDLGAVLPPVGAPAPALAPPAATGTSGRWLALAGAALAVGALGFGLLVWRPAWRAAGGGRAADEAMARDLRRLILAGAGLLLASAPLSLLGYAVAATAPGENALAALPALLGGGVGLATLARAGLALLVGALALRLPPPGSGPIRGWRLALAAGAALLLTFPLTGHGAAAGALAPAFVAAGLMHSAAMALWLGGLPPLLLAVVRARRGEAGPPLSSLVRTFTPLALGCVLVIAVSGSAQALQHVGSADLLTATAYGRALLVKLGAFAALIALGALHWLVVGPRLRPGGRWAGHFRGTLAVEIALGLLVLAAASAQLNVAPSVAAVEAQARIGQRHEARAEQVDLVLWVTPGGIGDNLVALDVHDSRGGDDRPPEVLFRFAMPGMAAGTLEAAATEAAPDRFEARGSYLTMGGTWTIEAILRRPGLADVRHTFVVDVRKLPAR
jgi:copper transport protein